MGKFLPATVAAAALLVGSIAAAAPAQADDRSCRTTLSGTTVDGNVKVPAGAKCVLKNVVVKGGVLLGKGSSVSTYGGTVYGNVQGGSAPRNVLLEDTRIKGDVQTKNARYVRALDVYVWGDVQAERSTYATKVHSSWIDGNIQTKHQAVEATWNKVNGNIQHEEGRSSRLVKNRVGGDIQVFKNRYGQKISYNTVGGNLQCKENSPRPAGTGNKVEGSKEDQCRTL